MQPEEIDQPVVSTKPLPLEKKGGKTKKVSKFGSRRQVYNGSAMMTAGGLTKEKLMKTERGRIVSAAKHKTMKQRHTS
jgi:hypothetical protein